MDFHHPVSNAFAPALNTQLQLKILQKVSGTITTWVASSSVSSYELCSSLFAFA